MKQWEQVGDGGATNGHGEGQSGLGGEMVIVNHSEGEMFLVQMMEMGNGAIRASEG